jgi:hypothetical protein
VVFDRLVQVLVFGCAYERIADQTCRRRRRAEAGTSGSDLGAMAAMERLVLQAYDRLIGLELGDIAVDGCTTKAPRGGELAGPSPVGRGKQGTNARAWWTPAASRVAEVS